MEFLELNNNQIFNFVTEIIETFLFNKQKNESIFSNLKNELKENKSNRTFLVGNIEGVAVSTV